LAANGDYYLDLVADPRLPRGMLSIAGADPAHRGLRRHSFLIDSGADCNLMDSAMALELLTMAHHPGISITGVTGNVVRTIGCGTLDMAFFLDGRLVSRGMGGPGATVFNMPPNARVRRGRICSFPPIRTAEAASERFNLFSVPTLLGFRDAKGHAGVLSYLVDPKRSYGASIAQRARGKAPARARAQPGHGLHSRTHPARSRVVDRPQQPPRP
jgi:hypothetical protein